MKELFLDIDNFNKPKTEENELANAIQLHHSLLGRRGYRVGDDIENGLAFQIRRFRFSELKDAQSDILTQLVTHCNKYIPDLYVQDIRIIRSDDENKIYVEVKTTGKIISESSIVFLVENKEPELLVNLINK